MEEAEQSYHFLAIVASTTDAIISKTLTGIVVSWNPGAEKLFGYSANEMIGQPLLKIFPPDRLNEENIILARIAAGETVEHFKTIRKHRDGHLLHISANISPIRDAQGNVIGVSKIARDISYETRLKTQTELYQAIVDSSEDAIISKSLDGTIQSWNHGAELLFGYAASDIVGHNVQVLLPPHCDGEEKFIVSQIKQGIKVEHYYTQRKTKDGRILDISVTASPIKDISGNIIGISSISRDVTLQRRAEQAIKRLSERDSLTNLFNRHSFVEQLRNQLNQAKASKTSLAVLYMDLDRFKNINDKLGHEFGDAVLCHVAATIEQQIHNDDIVGRIGGDEFLVMLRNVDSTNAVKITQRILTELHKPFQINNTMNVISASAGIALYPQHGDTTQTLITHADHALYESKHAGRNTCMLFNQELDSILSRNQLISSDLAKAILAQQLAVYYQPIVDLKTETVSKAEALIRWQHPELGFVSPAEFIPIAEDNGCINDIGQWVFETVASQLSIWLQQYGEQFRISINKSPVQFQTDNHSPQRWHDTLQTLGIGAKNLVVEITEGCLMKSTAITERKLRSFSGLGFEIAIDDFGTGYSSLAYINKFHLDYLKIDRSFVSKIVTHPDQHQVCEGIILLAHKLGLKVIAEGIETEEQHHLLQRMGCDYGQGYWYSRPVPAAAFEQFMQRVSQYSHSLQIAKWGTETAGNTAALYQRSVATLPGVEARNNEK